MRDKPQIMTYKKFRRFLVAVFRTKNVLGFLFAGERFRERVLVFDVGRKNQKVSEH